MAFTSEGKLLQILFDFRLDPQGQPWFLEAGLYCSFSPKSVIASMAKAAGIPLDELLMAALDETSIVRLILSLSQVIAIILYNVSNKS